MPVEESIFSSALSRMFSEAISNGFPFSSRYRHKMFSVGIKLNGLRNAVSGLGMM